MEIDVWKIAGMPWKYYLIHPLRWMRDRLLAWKWAHQRAKYGYAEVDWYNLCDWITSVIPDMFDTFAKNHYGYPGEAAGFTDKQWTDYLKGIAEHLRNASESQKVQKNEYDDALSAMMEEGADKVVSEKDDRGFIHTTFPKLTDEQKALRDKYFEREKEILAWRQNEAKTALNMIGDQIFNLWD